MNKTAKLIRQEDNLVKKGLIRFVEFNDISRGKKLHDIPEVGYSCIVNPGITYTWLTSVIIEVISLTEFKTKNSHYIITNDQ